MVLISALQFLWLAPVVSCIVTVFFSGFLMLGRCESEYIPWWLHTQLTGACQNDDGSIQWCVNILAYSPEVCVVHSIWLLYVCVTMCLWVNPYVFTWPSNAPAALRPESIYVTTENIHDRFDLEGFLAGVMETTNNVIQVNPNPSNWKAFHAVTMQWPLVIQNVPLPIEASQSATSKRQTYRRRAKACK